MSVFALPSLPSDRRRRQRRWRSAASSFTYGNSLIHSQTQNSRGLPSRIRDRSGSTSRLDYSYAYDKHGNITSIVDGVNANENRSLQYDARDRLTVATAANIYGEEIYDYDILDNVRRLGAYPNGLGGYVMDYRYQYTTNQRLTRIDNESGVQQWGFTHNGLGETLTRSGHDRDWYYQWNAAGRMTRADRYYGGTTWESYVYDAHGHRTRATRNTGTTRHQIYSRSGQLLYVEDTRDNQRIDYIHLGGKLVAQRSRPISSTTATTTYHHTDSVRSANVETNTAGTQTQRTVRMPYGSPYNGVYREGPGFAGHVTDTQTNLTYMQQRYYDPVALRFLSPDPVDVNPTNGSNFNRYWYANNNPYKYIDPDGMAPCTDRADCARRLELADQARGRDGRIIVGGVASVAIAGAAAAVATPSVLRAAASLLFKQQKAPEQAGHTIPKDRAPHIFREKEGHLSDTPHNRETLQRVADDPKTTLGTDKYGNTWSAQQNKDGSQVGTQTRDGEIRNAGVNESTRQFNPETGLSRQVRPDKEIK